MTVNTSPSKQEKSFSPVESQPKSVASLLWLLGGAVVIGVLLSFLVSILKVAATVDTRAIFFGGWTVFGSGLQVRSSQSSLLLDSCCGFDRE